MKKSTIETVKNFIICIVAFVTTVFVVTGWIELGMAACKKVSNRLDRAISSGWNKKE